jgi:hypothetical protein
MSKTYASRAAAGAVLSAALMAGSLSLAAIAASAGRPSAAALGCTEPDCIKGVPPATAVSVASFGVGIRTAINCPPPSVSDPGSGGC